MTSTSNQAIIAVTFYFDDPDNKLNQMVKRYIVQGWEDEEQLDQWLDEIAGEMNHLSGYGIHSIKVKIDKRIFTIDCKRKYTPYTEEPEIHRSYYWFDHKTRFLLGYYKLSFRQVWVEIPRIRHNVARDKPIPLYEAGDTLLRLRTSAYRKKKKRYYAVQYDSNNPFMASFMQRIIDGNILPSTFKFYDSLMPPANHVGRFGYGELPAPQMTLSKLKKHRKKEEKRKQDEERKRKRLEKSGIVYKTKAQKEKVQQVYIIQMDDDIICRLLFVPLLMGILFVCLK